jgi:phenylalanine-4-hydroxylase
MTNHPKDEIPSNAKHGALASSTPPPGAAADWTVPQRWEAFTAEEHRVWDILFARQQKLLPGRAVREFQQGLDILHLSRPGIPNLDELNEKLRARTGWTVVAVPGVVPDDVFFRHLSERRFPAGNFIRRADQLDYLEEPDVFHDIFGHVPLLAQPAVADFMVALGKLGLEALDAAALHRLARLYWYTVEFGLCREDGETRIYGAGILSSSGESVHALDSRLPGRRAFDLRQVLRTRYVTDAFQQAYFVIDRFEDVLDLVRRNDLPSLYRELDALPDLDPQAAPAERRAA